MAKKVNDTSLLCDKCGKRGRDSIAYMLRNGWRMCCGVAMTMVSTDPQQVKETMFSMSSIRLRLPKKV